MVISGQSGMGWDDRNNLWSFPNAFIALSSTAKIWAKKVNPFVEIEYLPNGVDLQKFTPKGRKYKTKLNSPIILCVGALAPEKRIDLVIKAVSKLKDTSLLIVGDGDGKEKLKALGKKLLGNRFELIKVSYDEMPKIYRTANVFTLVPAHSEAFGIVYVEAMASGLPIVAIDDKQRREIIGDAGILVDPENINAYAEALKKTLDINWKDKPRKQAEKFSWDKIAEGYEALFYQLCQK
jgi:glycosyltransferase involved in cell wall biosynthesis